MGSHLVTSKIQTMIRLILVSICFVYTLEAITIHYNPSEPILEAGPIIPAPIYPYPVAAPRQSQICRQLPFLCSSRRPAQGGGSQNGQGSNNQNSNNAQNIPILGMP